MAMKTLSDTVQGGKTVRDGDTNASDVPRTGEGKHPS